MKKDIRIIALDLDGTLLNSDKELTERGYRALEAAAAKGIEIVPTTGRFYGGMPEVIRDLPFVNYAITINGAQVANVCTGEVLYRAEIPWQRAVELMEYLDTLPVVYDCYLGNGAFMTAQMRLGQDLNSTNEADWQKAADLLKKGKDNLQSYVMDEVYGKMETGEASIAPYYAGDYLTMYETNSDLAFFYPEEGTNIFIDSLCIPKTCKNYDAAMLYINFLLEPQIATANAEYIGYASPNTAVINNPDYYYYQNEILYPDEADMPKVQYYHDIDKKTRMLYETLWCEVKLY